MTCSEVRFAKFLQFFFQQSQFFKRSQRFLRGGFIDLADGKTDVDDRVIADLNVRQICQADIFHDAAKVDFAHAGSAVFKDRFHLTGDG